MNTNKIEYIIAIDSELCAGAEEIARELSRQLSIPCYGEEILDKAAELSGISKKLMYRYDGKAVHAAYDLLAEDLNEIKLPSAQAFVSAKVSACQELAKNGPCILLDRHASFALKDRCVSIFIHADMEQRAERFAREHSGETFKHADKAYKHYYSTVCRDWGNADHYSLSVNAGGDPAQVAGSILTFLESFAGGQLAGQQHAKAM